PAGGWSTSSPPAVHERRSHVSSSATTVVAAIFGTVATVDAKPCGSPRGTHTRKAEGVSGVVAGAARARAGPGDGARVSRCTAIVSPAPGTTPSTAALAITTTLR